MGLWECFDPLGNPSSDSSPLLHYLLPHCIKMLDVRLEIEANQPQWERSGHGRTALSKYSSKTQRTQRIGSVFFVSSVVKFFFLPREWTDRWFWRFSWDLT